MPIGYLQARKGVRLQGPVVVVVGLNLGAGQAIFQLSQFAAQVGTRTLRIKRIKGLNQVGANTLLHIATAAAAGDVIPPLQTFDGLNFDFVEADLPEVEVNDDLLAWVAAAGVAGVVVQVEIEELG